MICNKCGKTIVDDAVFCSYCGAKQELSCEECGAKLSVDARFCHRCGAPTEKQIKNGIDWDALHVEAMKVFEDDASREELREAARRRDAVEWEAVAAQQKAEEAAFEKQIAQNFGKEEIPDVPTKEKAAAKRYYISKRGSKVRRLENGTLEINERIQTDNTVSDDTNPRDHLYSKITFYRGKYGVGNEIKELTDISAYALSDKGIYFAKDDIVKFWSAETGKMENIGKLEKILFMEYEDGTLTLETFHNLFHSESIHEEQCGGWFEVWEEVYTVTTKKYTVSHKA